MNIPITCDTYRARVIDVLDGGAEPDAPELVAHRATCRRCRLESEGLQDVWNALGELEVADVPELGSAATAPSDVGATARGVRRGVLAAMAAAAVWAALILLPFGSDAGPDAAAVASVATLRADPTVGARLLAAAALADLELGSEAHSQLAEHLLDEPSPHVQLALLRLLSKPEVQRTGVEAFLARTDLDPMVRAAATDLLSNPLSEAQS